MIQWKNLINKTKKDDLFIGISRYPYWSITTNEADIGVEFL